MREKEEANLHGEANPLVCGEKHVVAINGETKLSAACTSTEIERHLFYSKEEPSLQKAGEERI